MSSSPTSGFPQILKAALAPSTDFLSIVDASDTSASVNGTNKKVTIQDLVESVTDSAIASSLTAYVAKTGSTMTGALNVGSTSVGLATISATGSTEATANLLAILNSFYPLFSGKIVGDTVPRISMRLNSGIPAIGFGSGSTTQDILAIRNSTGQLDIRADNGIRIRNSGNTGNSAFQAGASIFSGTLALRNGNNAMQFEIYGNYTDASNYRRVVLSSTTGGGFTLKAEGLGTGASGNTLELQPSSIRFGDVNDSSPMIYSSLPEWLSFRKLGTLNLANVEAGIITSTLIYTSPDEGMSAVTLAANSITFENNATPGSPVSIINSTGGNISFLSDNVGAVFDDTANAFSPSTHNVTDLGVTGTRWRNLFLSGTLTGTSATFNDNTLTYSDDDKVLTVQRNGSNVFSVGYGWGYDQYFGDTAGGIVLGRAQYGNGYIAVGNIAILHLWSGVGVQLKAGHYLGFAGSTFDKVTAGFDSADLRLYRDGADTLALYRSTNANRLNIYGTRTDSSNYRRFYISSTTAGAFTIGVQGLGTGASGNTLTVANALTVSGGTNTHILKVITSSYINNEYGDINFEASYVADWKLARIRAITRTGYAGALAFHYKVNDSSPSTDTTEGMRLTETGMLTLGGITSGNPALKKNGASLQLRRGDDSTWANLDSGPITITHNDVVQSITFASRFLLYCDSAFNFSLRALGTSSTTFSIEGENGASATNHAIRFGGAPEIWSEGTNALGIRRSANAQALRIYGTYTDASNYRRLYISSTTTGDFNIGVQGLGTGASGNTLTFPTGITVQNSFIFNTGSWSLITFNTNGDSGQIRIGNNSGGPNADFYTTVTGNILNIKVPSNLNIFADNGLNVKNNAGSADAAITCSALTASTNIRAGSSNTIGFTSRCILSSPQDNVLVLSNAALNDFGTLRLGGSSSSYPAINRSAAGIDFRLADNGNFCNIRALAGTFFGTLSTQNWTTSTRIENYNTYTDASNYIRQALSFTTYSGRVHAQLAAEGLGTGAVNIPYVITPRGAGAFIVGPMPDGTSTGGNARGVYAVDIQPYRTAATQVVDDYGVGIGTQITVSSTNGSVAIGRSISVSDGLGGAIGMGRNSSVTGSRGIAMGMTATATQDAISVGTASSATHANAICVGCNTTSRWSGTVNWKGFFNTGSTSYLQPNCIGGIQWYQGSIRTTNNTSTTLDVSITSSAMGARTRHKGVAIFAKFTVIGIRSDGAINKYDRRVLIKDLASVDGTTSTLTVLQTDTIGTDVTEISGVSIAITANSGSKTLQINVTGEPGYAVTGNSTTDVLTAVGHPFANNDIVVFTALTGGAGLSTNVNGEYFSGHYKVINVSGNDFQLAPIGAGSTPTNFTTDITSGTICRPIVWYTDGIDFTVVAGGY